MIHTLKSMLNGAEKRQIFQCVDNNNLDEFHFFFSFFFRGEKENKKKEFLIRQYQCIIIII